MALSEKTISKHNIKRAEVFAAHGLGDADVAFAHPAFAGCSDGDTDCVLCGHRHIIYLFSIRFAAPDLTTALGKVSTGLVRTEEVTLKFVGSKCITDWLDAVPESAAKLEALKRWAVEVEKMKRVMVAKVVEKLCAEAGFESPLAAFERFKNADAKARWKLTHIERAQLKRNAFGIKNATATRATVKTWLANLAKLVEIEATLAPKVEEIEAAPEKPADDLAHVFPADAEVIRAARKAWESGKANLDERQQAAVISIAKFAQANGQMTASQFSYFKVLLAKLEAAPKAPKAPEAPKPVAKPEPAFTSPSGIAGARY